MTEPCGLGKCRKHEVVNMLDTLFFKILDDDVTWDRILTDIQNREYSGVAETFLRAYLEKTTIVERMSEEEFRKEMEAALKILEGTPSFEEKRAIVRDVKKLVKIYNIEKVRACLWMLEKSGEL